MGYWALKAVLTPILRLLFRPWVQGLEHVPARGPAIFASNHVSFSDSIFLPLVVPRRVTFLAKAEYFTGPGIKGRLTAAFFRAVGQVPIDRSGAAASEAALQTGKRILARGELLGIYPEGTRSPDGRLYRGKTGVARLALEAGVPVIPVAMIGTFEAQPSGQLIPNIRRIGVRIGKPLDFSRYQGLAGDRFVLRSMTDEIMYQLMLLSGQEYVDVYAAQAKQAVAGGGAPSLPAPASPSSTGQPPAASPSTAQSSAVAQSPAVVQSSAAGQSSPAGRPAPEPERRAS